MVSEHNFDPRSSYSPTSFDPRSFRPLFRRTFSPPFIPTPTRSFPTFPLPPHLKVSTFFGRRDLSSLTNEICRRHPTRSVVVIQRDPSSSVDEFGFKDWYFKKIARLQGRSLHCLPSSLHTIFVSLQPR